jgi:hypothetical protein
VLKPILIGLLVGMLTYSCFLTPAINIGSETIPNLVNSLSNYEAFEYAYAEMLEIADVKNLLQIGLVVSLLAGYIVYFAIKLRRDFIPFVAFEMPITSKRAVAMNKKVLKGTYIKFFITNFIVTLLFAVPLVVSYLTFKGLGTNEVLSPITITLVSTLVFCVLIGPIATFKQLHYIHSYKSHSKPFKEDFDKELKNVIKEIEELQKIINKKDEK